MNRNIIEVIEEIKTVIPTEFDRYKELMSKLEQIQFATRFTESVINEESPVVAWRALVDCLEAVLGDMDEVWKVAISQIMRGNSYTTEFKRGEIPKTMPFIIHGNPHHLFPTHTHGLASIGLPEMFIHSKAFGVISNGNITNADIINNIFIYLSLNSSEWDKVTNREDIETQLTKDLDLIFCIRSVDVHFSAVRMAYGEHDLSSPTGFSQIYVKGEDHVLDAQYFLDEYEKLKHLEDKCECPICRGEK